MSSSTSQNQDCAIACSSQDRTGLDEAVLPQQPERLTGWFVLLTYFTCDDAGIAPLDCPPTTSGGDHYPEVSRAEIEAWHIHTNGKFDYGFLSGEHFFINESSDRLRDYLCEAVDRSFETAPAAPLPSPE